MSYVLGYEMALHQKIKSRRMGKLTPQKDEIQVEKKMMWQKNFLPISP